MNCIFCNGSAYGDRECYACHGTGDAPIFDQITYMSQDEFVEAFQGDWPAKLSDQEALAYIPSFDPVREVAYKHINERICVVVA